MRVARRAFEISRRSALDVAAFLRRLGGRVELDGRDAVQIATVAEQVKHLEREHQARVAAGVESAWLPARRAVDREQGRRCGRRAEDPQRGTRGPAARVPAIPSRGRRRGREDPRADRRHARAAAAQGCRSDHRERRRVGSGGRHCDGDGQAARPGPATPRAGRRYVRSRHAGASGRHRPTISVAAIVRDTVLPGRPVGLAPARLRSVDRTHARQRMSRTGRHAGRRRRAPAGVDAGSADGPVDVRAVAALSGNLRGDARVRLDIAACDGTRRPPDRRVAPGISSPSVRDRSRPMGLSGAWIAARVLLRHYTGKAEPGDDLFGFARLL